MHRTSIAVLFMVIVVASSSAGAQAPSDAARNARVHFDRGLTLFNQHDFEGSLAEFSRSYELNARPSVLYNLGVTYQALHRYPEAARSIDAFLHTAQGFSAERRAQVEAALTEIRALIAYVRVVAASESSITLDGEIVTLPPDQTLALGPGRHTLEASHPTLGPARESFTIASGETRTVTLNPTARTVPPPSPQVPQPPGAPEGADDPGSALAPDRGRVENVRLTRASGLSPAFFLTGLATTTALFFIGLACGLQTLALHDDLSEHYTDELNSPSVQGLMERGNEYRLATNFLWGAAALVGVGTLVLLPLTRFRHTTRVEVGLLPPSLGAGPQLRVAF